jgi:hypothetical protein
MADRRQKKIGAGIQGRAGFRLGDLAEGDIATWDATNLQWVQTTGGVPVPSYTIAGGLPAATTAGLIIYISDETGGATLAFSDGVNWKRAWDLATAS